MTPTGGGAGCVPAQDFLEARTEESCVVLYFDETFVEVEADEAEELCVGIAHCGSVAEEAAPTQIQLAVAARPERSKAAPLQ